MSDRGARLAGAPRIAKDPQGGYRCQVGENGPPGRGQTPAQAYWDWRTRYGIIYLSAADMTVEAMERVLGIDRPKETT